MDKAGRVEQAAGHSRSDARTGNGSTLTGKGGASALENARALEQDAIDGKAAIAQRSFNAELVQANAGNAGA